ncbi:hypothetical protein [Amycolatopsis anabasis]|uniref:hypothetical protein n=1 Tax=Amycolatopsis anabasis TaxID=1840409 RepID=UPI00131CF39F|nr:hypothetical protein [Amycolatopsis anabasis]
MGGIRESVAVIVAADSPAGKAARAIDDVAAHLPPPEQPYTCPLCSSQPWPCTEFHDAAHRVQAAGVRLGALVPLDLHHRLWPRTAVPQHPGSPVQQSRPWFDKEQPDG